MLFNYIYINNSDCEKIGLNESDYEPFTHLLKRLELYAENKEAYELMPINRVMDEKIIMWAIKEIYASPYKIYINKLDRSLIMHKYAKTKKYIMQKMNYTLEDIINYFIVCLQDELKGAN